MVAITYSLIFDFARKSFIMKKSILYLLFLCCISLNSFAQATSVPLPPNLSNATSNTITVSITPDGNPGNTPYDIFCVTTGQYVQLDGSLGSSQVGLTSSGWGNMVVTGLSPGTSYCFYTIAYDGSTPIVGTGTQILAAETFSTNANFSTQSGSGPTNMFWSPSSCTNGGLTYSASGGCTDGYVGKTGNWTNFFGCFLRTPAINCTGQDSVILNLDISNSYFASQATGDKIRFYMWVDGGYQKATSIKIGGQEVGYSDINGLWLRFDEARNCVNVDVTFDLTGVSDPSGILFYMEANNGYNNSNTFSVKLDNISMAGGAPTTSCLLTTACTAASIVGIPQQVNSCANLDTVIPIITSGSVASYQWQLEDINNQWVDLSNGAFYLGVNTDTLRILGTSLSMNLNRYRCIVTGVCSGTITSSEVELLMDTLPTSLGVLDGPTEACVGDVISYTFTADDATFWDWTIPGDWGGDPLSNDVGISVTVGLSSGEVVIMGGNRCGQAPDEFISVTSNPLPTVTFEPADTFFCVSDPAYDLQPYASPQGGTFAGPGISGDFFIPAVAGIGIYEIIYDFNDISTGCSNQSSAVFVVEGPPTGIGNLSGPTEACPGEELTFTYTQANSQYAWSYPNGWTGIADSSTAVATLTPDASGTISVAEYNTCGSGPSATVNVTVNTPPTAEAQVGQTSFFASGGTSYVWVDCDNNYTPVGSTATIYMPPDFYRFYAVIAYDANGCSDTSDCVQLLTVGEKDLQEATISIYPNPVGDYTTITLSDNHNGESISIYDMDGSLVRNVPIQENATQVMIDMSGLSKGLYTFQMISNSGDIKYFKVVR